MTATPVAPCNWNWNCERVLGTGGFGIVQLWVNKQTGQRLAIKQCKWDDNQLTRRQKERWEREVEIMKLLSHKNIVKCEHLPFQFNDKNKSLPALCMEYCSMGDLRKVLNKPENCCGIKEIDALKIMSDILSAVQYLHTHRITHRDLKPENIVLQAGYKTIEYKLIDLGYAKEIGEASTSGSIVGTLNYIAPEFMWNKKYSCSVDYWSLGILFYEVLTGKRPFLPHMQHTMMWMQIIKNKFYDDICAYECDGKILFRQDIEEPVDLSSCIRSMVVEWLKVVLQWDPKKRGKQLNENGMPQLVVFKLLESTLSQKIIYVFHASSCKIYTYVVDNGTLEELSPLIEKDTGIPKIQQIVTDYYGNVVKFSVDRNSILFLLKTEDVLLQEIPPLNIPSLVQQMIDQSRIEVSFEILRDYYRATIFLMRRESHLLQLYIFALTIRVDLINTRLVNFEESMKMDSKRRHRLVDELNSAQTDYDNQAMGQEKINILKNIYKKIKEVLTAAKQIQLKFATLNADNNVVRNIVEEISIKSLSETFDEALAIFETFKKVCNRTGAPVKMVKVLFEFIKHRHAFFREKYITELSSRIINLENELYKLERSYESVSIMAIKYESDLEDIMKRTALLGCNWDDKTTTDLYDSVESRDSLIYENLIVFHTVDNLMTEIQKMYQEIVRFDP